MTRRLPVGPFGPLAGLRLALLAVALLWGAAAGAAPAVGEKAPDFALQGSDGETHRLARFLGKGGVVLAWFPKAFTPG